MPKYIKPTPKPKCIIDLHIYFTYSPLNPYKIVPRVHSISQF